jgi:hypothetical protein
MGDSCVNPFLIWTTVFNPETVHASYGTPVYVKKRNKQGETGTGIETEGSHPKLRDMLGLRTAAVHLRTT